MRLAIALLTLSLLVPVSAPAQTAVDPSGHWEGTIQAPEMETKIEIDLARDGAGALIGTFGQPGERLTGLPLSDFALDGTSIRFQIKGKAGERAFDGKLSADGKSITGSFHHAGVPDALQPHSNGRREDCQRRPEARALATSWSARGMGRSTSRARWSG